MKKLKKVTKIGLFLVSILLFALAVFVLFMVWVTVREPYKNDSIPTLLNQDRREYQVSLIVVKNPNLSGFTIGKDCLPEYQIKPFVCTSFKLGEKDVYFYDYPLEQRLTISEGVYPDLMFRTILLNTRSYPGNIMTNMKGNGQEIIFQYEGWSNPKKYIKLTPK